MKKGPAKAGPKASNKRSKKHYTEAFPVLQTSPGIDKVPHIRHLPSSDRQDVVDLWWNLRLQGIHLPAQAHVIILRGWRP